MTFEATARQKSEIAYHKSFAEKNAALRDKPVSLEILKSENRRWWNAYWATYTILLGEELTGKNVLVSGCGFGDDAIRLANLGAQVFAFDISPNIVEITRGRVSNLGLSNIDVRVMPSETMEYENNFFDYAFFLDILHHVDIPRTAMEIKRVVKSGGRLIGDELYTHSFVQKNIRESWLVKKFLYPSMQGYIYDQSKPYITDDEHKIDEDEFRYITELCSELDVKYYNTLSVRPKSC